MEKIIKAFKQIGANAVINLYKPGLFPSYIRSGFRISIREDNKKHASCFVLNVRDETQVYVPDVSVRDHALLLKVNWAGERGRNVHEEFLCGRDDHGWFVSTLGTPNSNTVIAAFESLRPEQVTRELLEKKVHRSRQNKHRNSAFIRQGEWFFIPMPPDFKPDGVIREKERLGARGKPHIADFVCSHGEARYTHPNYLGTMTWAQVSGLMKQGVTGFRQVFVVQTAFAKGRVVHPDHKTVFLDGWHRVVPNTENTVNRNSGNRLTGTSNAFID